MEEESQAERRDALAEAQRIIARQADEIERLRRWHADETLAEELRSVLVMAATAGTLALPVTHSRLLEMIVETAARVISAQAASLFLLDTATQELVFEVALGEKAEQVKTYRVPLGHGIAGLVAVTGQAMAISDVQHNPQHAADIAYSVGYLPKSILCVPLFYDDQVIGVLEMLDKEGASSFTPRDMDILGLFANQAAVAIEQSRTHQSLTALIWDVLVSGSGPLAEQTAGLKQRVRDYATRIEEDVTSRQAFDLARLVHDIVLHGEAELKACQAILRGFNEYLRLRPGSSGDLGTLQ